MPFDLFTARLDWTGLGDSRAPFASDDPLSPVSSIYGSGRACAGAPWNVRGAESAETWADAWNALAARRGIASRRRRNLHHWRIGNVDAAYFAAGRCTDPYTHAWGRFHSDAAAAKRGSLSRAGGPGWGWDRRRRQEAAAGAPLSGRAVGGWQMVGGVTAARLMAAGKPLSRYERDRGIEVTPAGKAALARWAAGRSAPAAAPALAAGDLHDLSRCLCVRCSRERREARAHAEAVERVLRDGTYRAGGADGGTLDGVWLNGERIDGEI